MSKKQSANVGTSGAGSASHMTLARFNAATGANITHVPYRGGGALLPDLLSGSDHRRDDRAFHRAAADRYGGKFACSASRGASARRSCPMCRP